MLLYGEKKNYSNLWRKNYNDLHNRIDVTPVSNYQLAKLDVNAIRITNYNIFPSRLVFMMNKFFERERGEREEEGGKRER